MILKKLKKLITLMIGVTQFAILNSCVVPTIKNPVKMFAINTAYFEAGKGLKNLNIKDKKSLVGEWVNEIEFINLKDAPTNMMCFSQEDWLKIIKPKLKEGAQYYYDNK